MPTNMFMLEYEDALMISQLIRISSDHPGPTDEHRLTSALCAHVYSSLSFLSCRLSEAICASDFDQG